MSSANVKSIDALRDFRTALVTFAEGADQTLSSVNVEIARMIDWLQHDQLKYWQHEHRRREDAVGEARADLNRCLMSKGAGEGGQCSDQKKALDKAKRRLAEAEDKLEKVKHWSRAIEQEVSEYRGPAQQLGNMLVADLPKAFAVLDRKVAMLEAYADIMPGGGSSIPQATSQVSNAPAANPAAGSGEKGAS
jgi:hypothetical protein